MTPEKELTERAVAAVHALHEASVLFAVTSGRPPRGMAMLVEPLALSTPIAAFNGGLIVQPDMTVSEQRVVPADLVEPIVRLLEAASLDAWVYRGAEWYVRDLAGAHVGREASTVQFEPTLVSSYEDLTDGVAKIVGVSDDLEAVASAASAAHDEFGEHVSASRSQPYYVDVTHPDANKGSVVKYLAGAYDIPAEQIATIGDMPNDVLMFAHSGLSIAMGNAGTEVQRAARRTTASNTDDGFAVAVERYVLG